MSNQIVPVNFGGVAVPEHIKARAELARTRNAAAIGGIKAGGFPRLSIQGGKFHIVDGGEKKLITDGSGRLPLMELELVVLGSNPAVSKTFYASKYELGSSEEPDCSSDDGVYPDPTVKNPQSKTCANCPQNQWGSKISEAGKEVKACADNKRLVVVPAADIKFKALSLLLPPASLKEWAKFAKQLDEHGLSVTDVTIKVTFDPSVEFPKLVFLPGRYLSAEEIAIVDQRSESAEVKDIIFPRRAAAPQLPAPAAVTTPVPNPAPVKAPTIAPAPTPAPAPAPAPAPVAVDPFAGFEAIKPAIDAVGGLTTDIGRDLYKKLTGRDVPVQAGDDAEDGEEETGTGDPLDGLTDQQKTIVVNAGGPDSPAGGAVLAAFKAQAAAQGQQTAEEAPKRRGRKKAAETVPPTAPAAPATFEGTLSFGNAPTAAPAAPPPTIPGGAAAPAAVAVSGDLGATLDALFAKK